MCSTCNFLKLGICVHDPSQFIQRALLQRKKQRQQRAAMIRGNTRRPRKETAENSLQKRKSKKNTTSVDPVVRDSSLLVESSESPFSEAYEEVWKSIHKRHSSTLCPKRGRAKQGDAASAVPASPLASALPPPSSPAVDWTWNSMEYANLQDSSQSMWLSSATQELQQFKSLDVFGLMKLREAQLISDSTDIAPPSKLVLVLCRRLLGQLFSNSIRNKQLNLLGAIVSELLFHGVFARANYIKNAPPGEGQNSPNNININTTREEESRDSNVRGGGASASAVLTWHETCHQMEEEKDALRRKLAEIEGTVATYMESFTKIRDGVANMASRWQKPAIRTYFHTWQKAVETARQGRKVANLQSANLKLIRLAMSMSRSKSDGKKLSKKTPRMIRAFLKLMLQAWRKTTVESNRSNVSKTTNTLEAHMATCRRQMLKSKEKLFTLKREKVRVMSSFIDISKILNTKRSIYRKEKVRIDTEQEAVMGKSLNTLSACSSGFFEAAFMARRVLEETERLQMWMPESTSTRLYLGGRDSQNWGKKWCTGPIQKTASAAQIENPLSIILEDGAQVLEDPLSIILEDEVQVLTAESGSFAVDATLPDTKADSVDYVDYGYSIEIADVRAREFANSELDLHASGDVVPFGNMMEGAALLLRSHGGCRSDFEALVERIVKTEGKLLPWRHEPGEDRRIKSDEDLQVDGEPKPQSGPPVVDTVLDFFRHLRQEMAAMKEEDAQKAAERAKKARALRHEQRKKEKQANAGLAGLAAAAKESKETKTSKNHKEEQTGGDKAGNQDDKEDLKNKPLVEAAHASRVAMEIDRLRVFLARLEMLSQASNRR